MNNEFRLQGEAPLSGTKIVVKFVLRYGTDGHKLLSEAGFAPMLFSVRWLPAGWLMVVMERVDAPHWKKPNAAHCDQLREAVAKLHAANLVHGDLREANVLISEARVLLIDFDWCGKAGVAQYPLFINPFLDEPADHCQSQLFGDELDINSMLLSKKDQDKKNAGRRKRPDGALDNEIMKNEHDDALLEQLLAMQ